ncbi:MAG: N(1)-aminopropylagmatine ureohydrolase [Candidatus Micrarchaeota archaeon]|nr:MAG: N(1)-aminopropylagmatine ureohydrolase [Candidatus Micrarchaeota archaeon]
MTYKVSFSNSSIKEANVVLFGVPDQSGCKYAKRQGTKYGPNAFRKATYLIDLNDPYAKNKKLKIADYKNIRKDMVEDTVRKFISQNKLPVIIGGDHSITYHSIKGISKEVDELSIIYLGAHYDTVKSIKNYHGSVLYEISKLKM